ncbi:MAG TPA: aldo/keto reductase [Candidatus Eisenbacteria bacterium]|nr:aldo/keto reductase [Candidatus Eisenbacteria bacterium]
MITRPLGRTGHHSSVLAFGGAAFWADQDDARAAAALEDALARGVNHVDVAPSYGEAERVLGPAVARHRDHMFLACKTRERRRGKARDELHRSLERLHTDRFDLYQCHAVSDAYDLDRILGPGGAMEAILEAREQGLVRFIGITGHHCSVLRDALARFAFDTVMFPVNPIQAADPRPATDYRPLLAATIARGVGAIGIKAIALGPWATRAEQTYTTWYRPSDDPADMARRLRFALTHLVATTVLPSDTRLWPPLFETAERLDVLGDDEMEAMIRDARGARPLYVESMKLGFPAY